MNPIYWLTAIKPYKHLSNHFILLKNDKFMVFTSSPVKGLKNHLISNAFNIEGRPDPQYLVENIHTLDLPRMTVKVAEKGVAFYAKHYPELSKFLEKMQPVVEKIS